MSYDPRHAERAIQIVALAELDAHAFSCLCALSVPDIDDVIAAVPTSPEEQHHAAIAIAFLAWTVAAWYREIQQRGGADIYAKHRYHN